MPQEIKIDGIGISPDVLTASSRAPCPMSRAVDLRWRQGPCH